MVQLITATLRPWKNRRVSRSGASRRGHGRAVEAAVVEVDDGGEETRAAAGMERSLAPESRAVPGGADLLAQRRTVSAASWGDHVLRHLCGGGDSMAYREQRSSWTVTDLPG